MKKKIKFSIPEVVCYLMSLVFIGITIFMIYSNITYLNDYMTAYKMTFSKVWKEYVQTVISEVTPYIAYSGMFLIMGISVRKINSIMKKLSE